MVIKAKFASVCGCGCGKKIEVGADVFWKKGEKAILQSCYRKKTGRVGNNPWVTKAMTGKAAQAFGEAGVYFSEYEDADEMEIETCGCCGGKAYYKPSVGAYVCFNRHLKIGEEWSGY